jgi:hypothetical protein
VRPARRSHRQRDRAGRRWRVKGEVISPTLDVDADIAIIDTGIGPVGGGELNIAGGINCSGGRAAARGLADLDAGSWHACRGHRGRTRRQRHRRRGHGAGCAAVGSAHLRRDRLGRRGHRALRPGLGDRHARAGPGTPGIPAHRGRQHEHRGLPDQPQRECRGPIFPYAVCAAVRAGVTLVAAAGNGATDAGAIAPAGYDQVITVGAITDLDGAGWGEASTGCSGEQDDAWASYSNHGHDVDILAPGSCTRP